MGDRDDWITKRKRELDRRELGHLAVTIIISFGIIYLWTISDAWWEMTASFWMTIFWFCRFIMTLRTIQDIPDKAHTDYYKETTHGNES